MNIELDMDKDPFLRFVSKDPFLRSVFKDPCTCSCPYLFEYFPDVPKKKTRILDNFNTDKKCIITYSIESSHHEIWKQTDLQHCLKVTNKLDIMYGPDLGDFLIALNCVHLTYKLEK